MNILNNASLQASYGPTVLSRRPVVRLKAAALSAETRLSIQAAWHQATEALAAGLTGAGVDPVLLAATADRPDVGEACHLALGDLLARSAASLMQEASAPGRDFGTVPSESGEILAYWNDWMDGLGRVAGHQAAQLVELAFADPAQLSAACESALRSVFDARVASFFYPMVRAAEARGIPWRAVRPGSKILSYGQGARQQWFHGTMSNRQSRAGVHLTMRKHLSVGLLRAAGLPVPEHVLVDSREEARRAASRLGFPVVVKPNAGSGAKNVFLNLMSEAATLEAFDICHRPGMRTLVEKQYPGLPYRVTVCDGKAFSALRHAVSYVVGDGETTLFELIERVNKERHKVVDDDYNLPCTLRTDEFAAQMETRLREQDITLDDIPDSGREVFLTFTPVLTSGGVHLDVSDQIHPSTLELAEEAARVLRAQHLGVDLVAPDITRPHEEVPLVINEVNAAPGVRSHSVIVGPPRDLTDVLFAPFFPPGDSGRIPIAAAIGGDVEKPLQLLERLLADRGETVGFADSASARVGDYRLRPTDGGAAHPGGALLRDKRPSVAVMSFTTQDVTLRGLPSDRLDIVAVARDVIEAARNDVSRTVLETLVSLPGEALVLPYGAETAWLEAAGRHRRVILVAEQAGLATDPAPGITLITVEGSPKEPRLAAFQGTRKDPLGRLTGTPEEGGALSWAAALMLGLGSDALAISRLVSARSSALTSTDAPTGSVTA